MSAKPIFYTVLIMFIAPLSAAAQDGSSDSPRTSEAAALQTGAAEQTTGPMTIERVHSGVLLAPDFKVTRFDGRTSELVGGYGGWLTDKTFFVGGGGYWLANGSRDRQLAYGGLVLQWMARGGQAFGYGVKGLVGGGESTLARTVTQTVRFPDIRLIDGRNEAGRQPQSITPQSITTTVRARQAFFIAEPEADAVIRLTKSLRLTVGAGYRLIAAERGDESRMRGPVGTIGLQLGGGY